MTMEFGIFLPIFLPEHAGHAVSRFAQTAEELGFDSLWTGDHVAVPRDSASMYPYGKELLATGVIPDAETASTMMPSGLPDALGVLQFAAACTERVKLGTTVLILAMRNPVITAQAFATLDVLSDGRAIAGIGVGWNREEFSTLAASFEQRGPRTDDYLEVMRRLWTLDDPSFAGQYYEIGNVAFYPRPIQVPHPPLWIGGNEEPALRRTVRFDGAWHFAYLDSRSIAERVDRLHRLADEAGKDPASFAVTGERLDLLGMDPKIARAEIQVLSKVGVSHLVVGLPLNLDDAPRQLEAFSREVVRAAKDA
jgi:probable F420-dependent oxidoreductase